jgi:hypothetical protein
MILYNPANHSIGSVQANRLNSPCSIDPLGRSPNVGRGRLFLLLALTPVRSLSLPFPPSSRPAPMSKFEDGSLAAMVAGGGLDKLRAAGEQSTNSKVLSIFYAQNTAPEGWVPAGTVPDTKLTASALADWLENLAYDVWLKLPVKKMKPDQLYSFVPPGVCCRFVLNDLFGSACLFGLFGLSVWPVRPVCLALICLYGTGVRKPSRGPNAGVRYDGRRKIWLNDKNKQATPVKKITKRKRGDKDGEKEDAQEEAMEGPWTEGQFLKTCVESGARSLALDYVCVCFRLTVVLSQVKFLNQAHSSA